MKHGLKVFLVLILTTLSACASQIVKVPINPYVNPEAVRRNVRKVAVMPFVIPDYLDHHSRGEVVSIQITNRFIAELSSLGVYEVVDGREVQTALKRQYPNPRQWIFEGSKNDAIRVGAEVSADAVVYGVIRKYFQGNLTDSEVELDLHCIEVSSRQTIWNIRELIIGRGGKKYLNETPLSVPPSRLADIAVADAARSALKINEEKGPINLVSISHRQAWGYGVMASGVALTAAGSYFYNESEKAYSDYRHSETDRDLSENKQKTDDYDKAWQGLGGLGVAAVGTGLYLVLTDHTSVVAKNKSDRRLVIFPLAPSPGAWGAACIFRF
jgi:hypothetical protein